VRCGRGGAGVTAAGVGDAEAVDAGGVLGGADISTECVTVMVGAGVAGLDAVALLPQAVVRRMTATAGMMRRTGPPWHGS
jgi:hypothetical protein